MEQAQPFSTHAATAERAESIAAVSAANLQWTRGDDARAKFAERMVASPLVRPAAREQYQKLATALHRAQTADGIKTVVVASAVAGEGKTLTAINLAITLSHSFGRRVLLVDADFRRPGLHDAFGLPLSPGLADAGQIPSITPIAVRDTLAVLPAGAAADPIRALSSDATRAALERAGAPFDWVLLDTPPIGLLSDAQLIAAHVDRVILVVSAGRTPRGLIQRAVDTFGRDRVLGVVLNRADDRAVLAAYYSHYYDHYAHYGSPREAMRR